MISLHWVLKLPQGMTAEQFDAWYLFTHTRYGKASLGITRYVVNRALANQPPAAEGTIFRVPQEYWNSFDDMEACWNSPSGHATLGDGMVNMGLDPGPIPGVAITQDRQFAVARPAIFSTFARGYRSRGDGTSVKFMAFGKTSDPRHCGSWYDDRFGTLGEDPRVREHIFGTTLGRVIKLGNLGSLPSPEQKHFDWALELWFDDAADGRAFLESSAFTSMWSALKQRSSDVVSALCRGQEMMVVMDPIAHRDD